MNKKTGVFSSLLLVLLVLSTFNLYWTWTLHQPHDAPGKPSFNIDSFYVFPTSTSIHIRNNGTATANNIKIELIYSGSALTSFQATIFVPILQMSRSTSIEIPIGRHDLEELIPTQWFTNISDYMAYVHVSCDEMNEETMSFHFKDIFS